MSIHAPPPSSATLSMQSKYKGNLDTKTLCAGPGLIIEATVENVHRHTIQDDVGYHRFTVITVRFRHANRRKYDEKGVEIQPTVALDDKLLAALSDVTEVKPGSRPDDVPLDVLRSVLDRSRQGMGIDTNNAGATLQFFGPVDKLETIEFEKGDGVRITSEGDSHFIATITVIDQATAANYKGDIQLGANWTSKISAHKDKGVAPLPGDDKEGVADEEWVCQKDR